jgi:hypothetical protein
VARDWNGRKDWLDAKAFTVSQARRVVIVGD